MIDWLPCTAALLLTELLIAVLLSRSADQLPQVHRNIRVACIFHRFPPAFTACKQNNHVSFLPCWLAARQGIHDLFPTCSFTDTEDNSDAEVELIQSFNQSFIITTKMHTQVGLKKKGLSNSSLIYSLLLITFKEEQPHLLSVAPQPLEATERVGSYVGS